MAILENDIVNPCNHQMGGISNVWLANYVDDFYENLIWETTYELSGFVNQIVWNEFDVERSVFNIEQSQEPLTNVFNKRFTATLIPHTVDGIDWNKRLSKGRFVVVYKDTNGRFYISGFDRGYYCLEDIHRTETFGGRKAYGLVFTEQSRYEDRLLAQSAIEFFEPTIPPLGCGDYANVTMDSDMTLIPIWECEIEDFN